MLPVFSHYFSLLNTFIKKGKDPDPDPYLLLMDPDPGGPKTCGSSSFSCSFLSMYDLKLEAHQEAKGSV
jgi:hypothetical protein